MHFKTFFQQIRYFVIFLNTQMDLFILKTDVEKFTSPYKKTLHLIFNITADKAHVLLALNVVSNCRFIYFCTRLSKLV